MGSGSGAGAGVGQTARGARPPSHVAYYVALVGVLTLLMLLICYFFYFCVKRVKELVTSDPAWVTPTPARPPPAYPVQPVVRDSASAMAKICSQLPPPPRGDTVFPAPGSPAAAPAHATPSPSPSPRQENTPDARPTYDGPKAPAAAAVTRIEITPAS